MKTITMLGVAVLATTPVLAQQQSMQNMDHSKMQGMHPEKTGNMPGMGMSKMDMKGPFAKAEMDMHMKMMSAKGADTAEAYNRKMIEHHRGALSMSQVALAQTRDPRTRATAQKVIAMQTKEIADLQAWLRSNNKRPQ